MHLGSDVTSVFAYKIAIMNPVAMAMFFDITCKVVLLFLFGNKYYDSGLLGSV